MNRDVPLKKYAKKMNHSYTFGAFPTIELLKNQPEHVLKVLLHPDMNSETQLEIITDLCNRHNIPIERAAKVVEKLRDKENIFAVGVFEKYTNQLDPTADHIVLVNPSDMGNMGTIIRTSIGFGIENLAIIEPGVDVFNPKVVRASMGSLFQLNLQGLTHSIRLFLQGQSLYHGLPIPLLQEFRVLHLHLLQHPISLILCCIQNL